MHTFQHESGPVSLFFILIIIISVHYLCWMADWRLQSEPPGCDARNSFPPPDGRWRCLQSCWRWCAVWWWWWCINSFWSFLNKDSSCGVRRESLPAFSTNSTDSTLNHLVRLLSGREIISHRKNTVCVKTFLRSNLVAFTLLLTTPVRFMRWTIKNYTWSVDALSLFVCESQIQTRQFGSSTSFFQWPVQHFLCNAL